MHEELRELMGEFVAEGFDLVDEFERGLCALGKDPSNVTLLIEPARVAHTLKGTAGMFDCESIRKLARASDRVLRGAQHSERSLAGEAFVALHEAFHRIHEELRHLARGGAPRMEVDPALLDRLDQLTRAPFGKLPPHP